VRSIPYTLTLRDARVNVASKENERPGQSSSHSNFPCWLFQLLIREKLRISPSFMWEIPLWTRNGSNLRQVQPCLGRYNEVTHIIHSAGRDKDEGIVTIMCNRRSLRSMALES
jgi:hypothetical protein